MPFDPRNSRTLRRLRQNAPAAGFPVQNGGGIREPTSPSTPRNSVGERPISRSRQDSIQRPILSPSTERGGRSGSPQAQPDDRSSIRARLRSQISAGLAPPTPPGSGMPASNLERLEHGVDRQELDLARQETLQDSRLDQTQAGAQEEAGLQAQTSLSGTNLEQERQVRESREALPSAIEGIPQGTYDRIVNQELDSNLSPEQQKAMREDLEQQLRDYGDYPGRSDPKAPQPPIRPGKRSFNPFSGRLTGKPSSIEERPEFNQARSEYMGRAQAGLPLPPQGRQEGEA